MADNAIQAPGEASAEAQAIIKELEAEGHQIDGKPAANEPEKKVEEPKPEPKEPAKEPEPQPEKKPETPADDPEGTKKEMPKRAEKYVPVGKHNEERHRRQEAETRAEQAEREAAELRKRLADTSNKPNTEENLDDVRDMAKKLAEKHELTPEFVTEFAEEMVKLSSKRNVLPKDISEKLSQFEQAKAEADAAREEVLQDKAFDDEFAGVIKEFPDLADRKEDIKQLAFSEGNVNTALRKIALEYLHDNPLPKPGKKSAEEPYSGKKQAEDGNVIDFENLTEEDFKKMSYEEMDQYEKWRAKQGKK